MLNGLFYTVNVNLMNFEVLRDRHTNSSATVLVYSPASFRTYETLQSGHFIVLFFDPFDPLLKPHEYHYHKMKCKAEDIVEY